MSPAEPALAAGSAPASEASVDAAAEAPFHCHAGVMRAARPTPCTPTRTAARARSPKAEPAPENSPYPTPLTEILYAIDHGRLDSAEAEDGLSQATAKISREAEFVYQAICRAETGKTISEEQLTATRKASAELERQSHALAEKMTAAGFGCYRNTPFGLFRYHIHSGHVERLPAFRRVCFIPSVAQAIRAPMVAGLESFLERNPFARFWTFR